MIHTRLRHVAWLIGAVFVLTVCAPSATAPSTTGGAGTAAGPARGGTLRVALAEDFATLDPHAPSAGVDRHVMHAIYDPLVDVDEKLAPIPVLAESWTTPDPVTYIFKLRQGVKFHDGTDFDAEAMKWNIDRVLDPATKSQRASELASVKETSVTDKYTLKISLKSPFPGLFAVFADRVLPVSPTAAQKFGADFARNPVGAGPFQFVDWVKGDHLGLKRFEGYWGKDSAGRQLPYLDGVTFKFLTDDSTRLTALRTDNADLADRVAPKDVASVKADTNLVYSEILGPGYNQIYFNTSRPPFDNKALRQAFGYAIDRQAIHRAVYLGTGQVGEAVIPPSHRYTDPGFKFFGETANLDMAKRKLAEGGKPTGYEFNFEVFNAPLDLQLAELMKAQLQQVGIVAKIMPSESSALITRLTSRAHDYFTFRSSFVGRVDMDVAMHPAFTCGGSSNYMEYCNAAVDQLLNKARSSTNDDERKELYRQAQKIIVEDAPLVIMHYDALGRGLRKSVAGFVPIPDGILRFRDISLAK